MIRLFFLTLMLSTTLALTASAARQENPEDTYKQLFADRESAATDITGRVRLATDLYEAAKLSHGRDLKSFLCVKAFEWGKNDYPDGYHVAAESLQYMQRLAPERRLECLEYLDTLYYGAWLANTSKYAPNGVNLNARIEVEIKEHDLDVGVDLAEIKMQISQQRLLDLMIEHRETGLSKEDFLSQLNECKRDCARALTASNRVLSTAKSYSHVHVWPETREMLKTFVTKHQPLVNKIREEQQKINDIYIAYKSQGDASLPSNQRAGAAKHIRAAKLARAQALEELEKADRILLAMKEQDASKIAAAKKAKADAEARLKAARDALGEAEVVAMASESGPGKFKLHFQERRCSTCTQPFVPPIDAPSTANCYWCQKSKAGFFGLGTGGN